MVEIALRFFLAGSTKGLAEWNELLLNTEYVLNIFINATTDVTPFLLFYDIYSRSEVESILIVNEEAEEFFQERRKIREAAADAL
jgi:hypothetical protein